ncbi:hypothetical protein KY289_026330 [Solanum tuberosum]|nr:hypothetical protein KY289_026330 [Solanum tuberosum]
MFSGPTEYLFPNVNIETPPSMHPGKKICDITGFEAPYFDPRTKLRYANTEVFKAIRSLPNDYVQRAGNLSVILVLTELGRTDNAEKDCSSSIGLLTMAMEVSFFYQSS